MSSGVNLKGFDDILRNIEARLGEPVVRRNVNRALKET
ncbi:putative prophage protein, partial [Streptococcus pneumoniae]